MLPHQTQIKICPYISLGINSHSQIALVKLGKTIHPSRPGHMRNAFLSTVPGRPPLCTPKTSAWPPPTCPASPRQRPSCSPKRGCRGVGLPVGTRRLPRLGGRDLLPGGSRWSAEVSKHEKSHSSGPMCHGKGRKANKGHKFWTIVRTYYSTRQALFEFTGCQEESIYSIYPQCLLTLLANSHETTLGRPRRWLRLG